MLHYLTLFEKFLELGFFPIYYTDTFDGISFNANDVKLESVMNYTFYGIGFS